MKVGSKKTEMERIDRMNGTEVDCMRGVGPARLMFGFGFWLEARLDTPARKDGTWSMCLFKTAAAVQGWRR